MRIYITIFVAALFLLTAGFQCEKELANPSCLKAKVIDILCGDIILQVIEGEYDPSLVNSTWTDSQTGSTYTNVFAVQNHCDFAAQQVQAGDTISFRFSPTPFNNNCSICLATRPTPDKKNSIVFTGCP